MEFNMDFLLNINVLDVLFYVISAILVDTVFGIARAVKRKEFSFKELPRFLSTNLLPYGLGIAVLGFVAYYQGEILEVIFYATSVAVMLRYVARIKEKIKDIFGVSIKKAEE